MFALTPPPAPPPPAPARHAPAPAGTAGALVEARMRVGPAALGAPGVARTSVWVASAPGGPLGWRVTLDALAGRPTEAGRPAPPLLKDTYLEAPVGPADVRVGYLKLPLSGEALEPASALPTARRAAYNDLAAGFGLQRAVGVVLGPGAAPERHPPPASLTGGLFLPGAGSAAWRGPDAVARLAVHPSARTALTFVRLVGAGDRARTGVELDLEAEPVRFHAEALGGTDDGVRRLGWSTLATWRLGPAWQAVAGLAAWDDGRGEGAPEREATLGVCWHVDPHADVLADVVHLVGAEGRADDELLLVWRLSL